MQSKYSAEREAPAAQVPALEWQEGTKKCIGFLLARAIHETKPYECGDEDAEESAEYERHLLMHVAETLGLRLRVARRLRQMERQERAAGSSSNVADEVQA